MGQRTIAFDFDGVIHEDPHYRIEFLDIDVAPIREAHRRGYAVAIMTCNDVRRVAAALRRLKLRAWADVGMRFLEWSGGKDGKEILVTGRKIVASLYVDDKAMNWRYGEDPAAIFAEVSRVHGYHPCAEGQPEHWGPAGAAGILPYAVLEGHVYVLMSLRSRAVQHGGTWSTFGGALDEGEGAVQAAHRELREEVTGLEGHTVSTVGTFPSRCPHGCGWRYTSFTATVSLIGDETLPDVRVNPDAAWETTEAAWVRLEDVDELELHPGFAATWPRMRDHIEVEVVARELV